MNFDPVTPPKPIPGDSPMETLNRLYAEVCSTMRKCGELNCKTDQMLKDLHEHGLRNGVYYGPDVIKVEEGYCEEDSSPYKVIRIKHHDKYGAPVEVKMHLAYGNTTNSGIKEKITDASLFELAQVMVPAIGPVDHWNGKVLYQQAPLPSEDKTDGYTYGFTRHGTLKVYKNSFLTENPNALERDSIITAMMGLSLGTALPLLAGTPLMLAISPLKRPGLCWARIRTLRNFSSLMLADLVRIILG